ncbi:MAG: YggS family pyridoxal phosphate-dependent enzyme [Flavobacteriaceae bacterium]|nr:YggS family pyridoxal phosphate-dependent enzyme [Flavobacteriaceae bacterium]
MGDSISQNLKQLKSEISHNVTLVAVSKTKPKEAVLEAYAIGHRIFGENKVQEMTQKWEELPRDIQWHMIGHLQTNKVKYIAPYVSMIHSLDRVKLANEIDRQGARYRRVIDCLIQIKIAKEEEKFGFEPNEALTFLEQLRTNPMPNINIRGVMGMATFTPDSEQIKHEFSLLKTFFDQNKSAHNLEILSMGMSGDYPLALELGSNMIRVGSAIFGSRLPH